MSESNELHHLLGTISSDVKHILLRQDKQDARFERFNVRITNLEKFQWKILGIATFVPTALGFAIKLI